MKFHANLSEVANAPTEFRFLNMNGVHLLGQGIGNNYETLMKLFEESPGGGTPLCRQIKDVVAKIKKIEPELLKNGHKAVVVIATDGESRF